MLHLAVRLRALRGGDLRKIDNLRAYVVSTVYNASYARIRANCPKRAQLQNRIRYLLRNDGRFALWKTESGEYLAGVAKWAGRPLAVPAPPVPPAAGQLDGVMLAAFEQAGGPLGLGDLVSVVATALRVIDSDPQPIGSDEPASEGVAADHRMIQRQSLEAIWHEVLELPERQRAALLLNLRDASGQGVIELLPATGIASLRQLAAATGMTAAALAGIWNRLPLDDQAISELLRITRQQVINLRKSARDRLSRRMHKAAGNPDAVSPSDRSGSIRGESGTLHNEAQSGGRELAQ